MMPLTTTYKEFAATKPQSLRTLLRSAALTTLQASEKTFSTDNVFSRPRVQFMFFHHIFKDEIEPFDKFLKELSKKHTFISYSEAVRRVHAGENDEPCITFSSDDGFKNNLQASKILDRYGAKACFFINPDSIGLNNLNSITTFCQNHLAAPPIEFLDWNDLQQLMNDGHEIGSHTMTHINVAKTPPPEFEENLNESKEILLQRCGATNHFAYPYGSFSHFTKEAMAQVFKAGYTSCASAERGCYFCKQPIAKESLLLRRDHTVAAWPLGHNMHFIRKNASSIKTFNNGFPSEH